MALFVGDYTDSTGFTFTLSNRDRLLISATGIWFNTDGDGFRLADSIGITIAGSLITGGTALVGSGARSTINVAQSGLVYGGDSYGIDLTGNDVLVRNAGTIDSADGVRLQGDRTRVENSGTIVASFGRAVDIGRSGEGASLLNSGSIAANADHAVTMGGVGRLSIVNSGTVTGNDGSFAAIFVYSSLAYLDLANAGTIYGRRIAVQTSRGDDVIRNGGTISGDVILGAGNDTYDGRGGLLLDVVFGEDGDDTLTGGDLGDALRGDDGEDLVSGGGGRDRLFGGAGEDTIFGGEGDDVIEGGAGTDLVDGGIGRDFVSFEESAAGLRIDLAGIEPNTGDAEGDTFLSIEGAIGSSFDDVILGLTADDALYGRDGNDFLTGRFGNDLLDGGAGDDVLEGSAGNDRLRGGDGFDFADYSNASSGVTVSLAVTGPQNTSAATGRDVLMSIEGLIGSAFDDRLTGNDGDDTFVDTAGNDVYTGGGGFDGVSFATATGGVTVDLGVTTAQNTGGAGTDTFVGIEALAGTEFDDLLTGNAQDNRLIGDAGVDILVGGDGNDTLQGGVGNDGIDGGAGIDTADYSDTLGALRIRLTRTSQITFGSGTDRITGIENVIGGQGNDSIYGDGNSNLIEGGAGDDDLNGGAGFDAASYASAAGGVTVDLARTTAQNTGGAGVDTVVAFEALVGSAFDDVLRGTDGENTLIGGDGDDALFGLGGADLLMLGTGGGSASGGAGNDTIESLIGGATIDGGADFDTVDYRGVGTYIVVDFRGTTATVTDTSTGAIDRLTGIESVIGGKVNDFYSGAGVQRFAGGAGDDVFIFTAGTANGDSISNFQSGIDKLNFVGYGANASFTQVDAQTWRVSGSAASELITFSNAPAINLSTDVVFN